MSRILRTKDKNFKTDFDNLLFQSRGDEKDISQSVANIIKDVINQKNQAVIDFTTQFDNITLSPNELEYSENEIKSLINEVGSKERRALEVAAQRIRSFHIEQLPKDKFWTDPQGIELGWMWRPIARAGLYVPGGTASYPSSVLMNAIPASIAGVKEIVMVSPTPNGRVNPLVLLAAKLAGVDRIYKIGGAQAIAALAYGTETILKVDKIVGPGNAFVAEAKRQVFGKVGIDMVAGPSEVLIIADKANNPDWIAVDLLSQAEHDKSAQSILVTTSEKFAGSVVKAVESRLRSLDRREIAQESWRKNGIIIVTGNLSEAASLSDSVAPEHLQLCVSEPEKLLNEINNAGAVFLGSWTPEAIGDYIVGTNHVLPTGGSARFSSGLSVLDFVKRTTVSKVTPESIIDIGRHATVLAKSEGLGAHALSLMLRLDRAKTSVDE